MQELILKRVWIEADDVSGEQFIRNRIAVHPMDIHYYEEYLGSALEGHTNRKLTKLALYSGEVFIIEESFDALVKKMSAFREEQMKNNLFKNN